ncbi:hypothetical protein ACF0H5_014312 [Mactra antiquata]
MNTALFLSFRCLNLRDKELRKNNNRIAVLRNAVNEKIILKPNESINIPVYTDKEVNYQDTTALIHETQESKLPFFIDITPGIINYKYRNNDEITVNISKLNVSCDST